ncbi:MAG TPA: fibrillarin-like rRNA/tRNA 2'-O-methyltransferase [Patescibacteria group bacterium]|nr:fibrillarin-like rRNA/tRNA 2'-O-methyltransferase [Patescibacteria group bacterium]
MSIDEVFPGVYQIQADSKRILTTRNLTPGLTVYGEYLHIRDGVEYRSWVPFRSKLAAAIMKGLRRLPLGEGDSVLYLGVASGTTCSHISDIVGPLGHIWGLDFAPRSLRDLIENVAKHRGNISPILADARRPEAYSSQVPTVDVVYADVAQPDQAEIVVGNSEFYLKKGGWAIMAVKSRSIDVSRAPRSIYAEQVEVLERGGFTVEEVLELEPFEKDHALVTARYGV